MATVTLGNIKFNWKGAWNSGTAYVIDDVVSLSGSSYVSIQAGTNQNPASASAYWQQMSAAGTDGTDLTSTLTAQGDIVYRDGSGLAKLGAGTSGQFLKTQGTGANPVWATNTAGVAQMIIGESSTEFSQNSPNDSTIYFPSSNKVSAQITPSATSSRILVQALATCKLTDTTGDGGMKIAIKESISGGATTTISGSTNHYSGGFYTQSNFTGNIRVRLVEFFIRSPNTTSQITYEVGIGAYALTTSVNLNDDGSTGRIILTEVTV
jgi:hypothetical protein